MPYVRLQAPNGLEYSIATRQAETLRAWFDEWLPLPRWPGRPGSMLWPRIDVRPLWVDGPQGATDPDWITDSRVQGRWEEFPARTGEEGLKELLALRRRLEDELRNLSGGL